MARRVAALGATLCFSAAVQGCRPTTVEEEALQGTVEFEETVLAFEMAGKVTRVSVVRGDEVQPGAEVAVLDDSVARLGLEARSEEAAAARAQANLIREGTRPEELEAVTAELEAARVSEAQLGRNLERDERLLGQGAGTVAAVQDLRDQLARARQQRVGIEQRLRALRNGARRAEIQTASFRAGAAERVAALEAARLGYAQLRAPFPGTVLDVHVRPGEVVAPGTPVATIADVGHPYAELFVPEARVASVRVGTPVEARIDGIAAPVAGQIEHVARQTEFTPRYLFSERERPNLVVRVRARLEDPKRRLRAGLPVFVTLGDKNRSRP